MLLYIIFFSINVIDDVGVELLFIDVIIWFCKGCVNNGRCSFDNIIFFENDCFSLVVCECDIGYFGKIVSFIVLIIYMLELLLIFKFF